MEIRGVTTRVLIRQELTRAQVHPECRFTRVPMYALPVTVFTGSSFDQPDLWRTGQTRQTEVRQTLRTVWVLSSRLTRVFHSWLTIYMQNTFAL